MTTRTPPSSPILRRVAAAGPLLVALSLVAALAAAAESHRVIQRGRAFNLTEISIAAGDSLEFSNEDEFLHQIFVQSPSFSFDSEEQPPGQAISVKFPTAGTFNVNCHIHPKMDLKVVVK
jgi:plastocyanin